MTYEAYRELIALYTASRADIVQASGPSTLAGPSSVDSRLADDELAKSLGLELLMLYGDGGSDGRSMALYPLPIFDYASLATRFKTRCVGSAAP